MSFAVEAGEAAYLPLAHTMPARRPAGRRRVLARLKPCWKPATARLGQHLKYDRHVFANHGIAWAASRDDTLLQSYVLEAQVARPRQPGRRAISAWRPSATTTSPARAPTRIGFEQVAIERASEYAAEDADVTLRVHDALAPQIAAASKLELRLPRDRTAGGGNPVPHGAHRRAARPRSARGAKRRTRPEDAGTGTARLPGSRPAVQPQFAQADRRNPVPQKGLPVVKKTPGGAPSTDEEVLEQLALDYPLRERFSNIAASPS